MSISYEYYKIFYFVARYKSFNQAAKVLLNSQPNIARAINNLESDLNCTLFDRSHRGVTLTKEGEVLYEYIAEAHRLIRIGEDTINSMSKKRKGTVIIGLSTGITDITIRNRVLPPIKIFSIKNDGINLKVMNDSTPNLVKMISDESINLAVITTTKYSESTLREHILYSFNEIPIAGNAFRTSLYGRKVTLRELSDYPIITMPRDSESFETHDRLFAAQGAILQPKIETYTMRQALAFAENDMGIACIAEEYVRPAIERGSIFQIDVDSGLPKREISLIKSSSSSSQEVITLERTILDYNKNKT